MRQLNAWSLALLCSLCTVRVRVRVTVVMVIRVCAQAWLFMNRVENKIRRGRPAGQ